MSSKKVEQRHLMTSLALVSFDWATGKLLTWLVLGGSQVKVIGVVERNCCPIFTLPLPEALVKGSFGISDSRVIQEP